jgi:hypothetical protein
MPIKINLLAEAQEIEELKRRDPVKRFILVGVVLVFIILAWSSSLMVKIMMVKGEVANLEREVQAKESSHKQILENQKAVAELRNRIAALNQLAADRFLIGTMLNALQTNTVDNVQLTRIKLDQVYTLIPEVKAKDKSQKPKPATVKENVTLTLTARDKSPTPGDGVSGFQAVLSKDAYFLSVLDQKGFRLTHLGAAQTDLDGRPYVQMTLEGRFPEKIR